MNELLKSLAHILNVKFHEENYAYVNRVLITSLLGESHLRNDLESMKDHFIDQNWTEENKGKIDTGNKFDAKYIFRAISDFFKTNGISLVEFSDYYNAVTNGDSEYAVQGSTYPEFIIIKVQNSSGVKHYKVKYEVSSYGRMESYYKDMSFEWTEVIPEVKIKFIYE